MPQQSKYSNAQFEALMTEVLTVLEKHEASADLSLMVLGNLTTNVLNNQIKGSVRVEMAEKFTEVLLKSVGSNKA